VWDTYAEDEDDDVTATIERRVASDDYPVLADILVERPPLPHSTKVASKTEAHDTPNIVMDQTLARSASAEVTAGFWGDVFDAIVDPPPLTYNAPSHDWCRFRLNQRCMLPNELDMAASAQAGYEVWRVVERGFCPRDKWSDQERCPVSEPGPNSGHPKALIECTANWEDGGQRDGVPGPFRGPDRPHLSARQTFEVGQEVTFPTGERATVVKVNSAPYKTTIIWLTFEGETSGPGSPGKPVAYSLQDLRKVLSRTSARQEGFKVRLLIRWPVSERPEWLREGLARTYDDYLAADDFARRVVEWFDRPGQQVVEIKYVGTTATTAAWSDVRDKGTRIRRDGDVRIIAVTDRSVTAEVKGDNNVYQTTLIWEPGTRRSAMWECSCPWAAYSWGRSGRWKKYEGRKCSHAVALMYEAQSQEFGGGALEPTDAPFSAEGEEPFFYEPEPIGEWQVSASAGSRVLDGHGHQVVIQEGETWYSHLDGSIGSFDDDDLHRTFWVPDPVTGDETWRICPEHGGSCEDQGWYSDCQIAGCSWENHFLGYGLAPFETTTAARNSKFPVEIDPATGLVYLDGQAITHYPSYHPTIGLTASKTAGSWQRTERGYLSADGQFFLQRGVPMSGGGTNAWMIWERTTQAEADHNGEWTQTVGDLTDDEIEGYEVYVHRYDAGTLEEAKITVTSVKTAASIDPMPEFMVLQQFEQYPQAGPDGIDYFRGEVGGGKHIDCLLYREGGRLLGILNHYPFDFPPYERKGNVNVFVHPDARQQGIGTKLLSEAMSRWNVNLDAQDWTPLGQHLRRTVGVVKEAARFWPDGTELTVEDLEAIAIGMGVMSAEKIENLKADLHNANLYRSALEQNLRPTLHEMWQAGEITLWTGEGTPPWTRTAQIDPEDPDAGRKAVEEACEKGDHTHSGLVIKAVDSGRVLLTQRTPYSEDPEGVYGRWEFPGGGIAEGESALDSALREFTEETGLDLPEGWAIDGCYESGPYIAIVILVPNEGWTTNAELLDFETMGIGWFEPDQVEGTDLAREEMESADWTMVREALCRVAAAERTLMYRSDELAMTLCPRCYKRDPDDRFRPIKNTDDSLREGIEVCSDCGKTIVNRLPKDAASRTAGWGVAGLPEDGFDAQADLQAEGRRTATRAFHGTDAVLAPGDVLVPGVDAEGNATDRANFTYSTAPEQWGRVFVTPDPHVAVLYGERTYEVDFDGPYETVWFEGEEEWRTASPVRVVREIDATEARQMALGVLHDEPEPALPTTEADDGADEDDLSPEAIARALDAQEGETKITEADIARAASQYLAAHRFTPKEQQELIDEGDGTVEAANLDLLDIEGTHYAQIEQRMQTADDLFW
jgi:8-oxo-dGTP pyrophosphatase MutT (NUDIX family)/GNAT superfamily N-acetyltransferase